MLDKLNQHWRARRVLLVGGAYGLTAFTAALLTELGAKTARIPCACSREALFRALCAGRISAVIVPELHALCPTPDAPAQLAALDALMSEIREAGVPLTILCSDAPVYRAQQHPGYAREEDPIGGQTHDGLLQSILQLYADGVSRGLCGDAVRTLVLRHLPCLQCSEAYTGQYSQWCRALLAGEVVPVCRPSMQGVFVHPFDVVLGMLALGTRTLAGEDMDGGVFNLGAGAMSLCANRSAALRLIARQGGKRPICERESPAGPAYPLPDGAKARLLTGCRCQFTGDEALDWLFELERAKLEGDPSFETALQDQARRFLARLQ